MGPDDGVGRVMMEPGGDVGRMNSVYEVSAYFLPDFEPLEKEDLRAIRRIRGRLGEGPVGIEFLLCRERRE